MGGVRDPIIDESDVLRARCYALLGQLLARPPSRPVLDRVAGLAGDDTPMGRALTDLGAAAGLSEEAAEREYNTLFIGVTRGDLVPFASYYLAGFLHDRPLARRRADMAALGIAPAPGVAEPEDHIAALCEMMAGLITGAFGAPAGLDGQRRFFDRHVAPWAGRFFTD